MISLISCRQNLSPEAYVAEYEKSEVVETERSGFKISVLHKSPAYRLLQEIGIPKTKEEYHSQIKEFENHTCFNLVVRPATLKETMEGKTGNPFGTETLESPEAVNQKLAFLEQAMGAYFRLEDAKGKKFAPLAYRFNRLQGQKGVYSFVFVFPVPAADMASRKNWKVILEDFGLGIGRLEFGVKSASHLAIKV